MVCWDGSRNAARAVGDAMPLLRRAKPSRSSSCRRTAQERRTAGRRYRAPSRPPWPEGRAQRIVAPDIDVANTILSHAADAGIDFIVMGGYGHSRMREFVLGGATRGILASMTVPTLMSH